MTPKQKRFCDEYLTDLNATQAAVRAGYSLRTAYSQGQRMLKNVEIKSYIEEQLAKIHDEKTASVQEIVEYLTLVLRGEMTEQTLRMVGDGVQTIDSIDVPARERLKAAELLGKYYAMFTDRTKIDGAAPVQIVEDLPEDG